MKILFLRSAYKFIQKADKHLTEKIKIEVLQIQENPFIGNQLKSPLKDLHSHHFSYIGTQYRIAYKIEDNVIIICIATRENFYKRLDKKKEFIP